MRSPRPWWRRFALAPSATGIRFALAITCVGLMAVPAAAQDPERRHYDLSAILELAAEPEERTVLGLPLASSAVGPEGEAAREIRVGRRLEPPVQLVSDTVARILAVALGQDLADDAIDGEGNVLGITATPEQHLRIERLLLTLERRLRAEARFVLASVAPSTLERFDSGVLGPAETAAVQSESTTVPVATGQLLLGRSRRFTARVRDAVVRDFDIEVSMSPSIGTDPLVGFPFQGLELELRVDPSPDGRLFARLVLVRSRSTSPPRTLPDDCRQFRGLAFPSVVSEQLSASALVPAGGALLFGTRAEGGRVWLLALETEDVSPTDPPKDGDELRFLALEPLLAPSLPLRSRLLGPYGSGWTSAAIEEPAAAPSDGFRVTRREAYERALWPAAGSNSASKPSEPPEFWLGHEAILRSGSAEFDAVAATAAKLVASDARTVTLDVASGRLPVPELPPRTDQRRVDALVSKFSFRGRGSARSGDAMGIAACREFTYLKDFDLEIAPEQVLGDPVVDVYPVGVAFQATGRVTRDGKIVVRGSFADQRETAPLETRLVEAVRREYIELPHVESADGSFTVTLTPGVWTLVQSLPTAEAGQAYVLLARATL